MPFGNAADGFQQIGVALMLAALVNAWEKDYGAVDATELQECYECPKELPVVVALADNEGLNAFLGLEG